MNPFYLGEDGRGGLHHSQRGKEDRKQRGKRTNWLNGRQAPTTVRRRYRGAQKKKRRRLPTIDFHINENGPFRFGSSIRGGRSSPRGRGRIAKKASPRLKTRILKESREELAAEQRRFQGKKSWRLFPGERSDRELFLGDAVAGTGPGG